MKKYFYKFLKNDNKGFIIFETSDLETFKYQLDKFLLDNYKNIDKNIWGVENESWAQMYNRIVNNIQIREVIENGESNPF